MMDLENYSELSCWNSFLEYDMETDSGLKPNIQSKELKNICCNLKSCYPGNHFFLMFIRVNHEDIIKIPYSSN